MPRIIGGGFKPKVSHYKELTQAYVDASHCGDCNVILLSVKGKVHAIPDNSDKSTFGTKRLCHACFLAMKEAEKKKDMKEEEKESL